MIRRRSSGSKGTMEPLRSDDPEVMQHLKHLGPSNAANRPKSTRINTVKIKPGGQTTGPDIPKTIPENSQPPADASYSESVIMDGSHAPQGGIGAGLLSSAGLEASDGVHSLAMGYGTIGSTGDRMSWKSGASGRNATKEDHPSPRTSAKDDDRNGGDHFRGRSKSVSTIASLRSLKSRSPSPPPKRHTARSGSISENIVDFNGIQKMILETTSSSDDDDKVMSEHNYHMDDSKHSDADSAHASSKGASNKKRRKKRGKKKKNGPGDGGESQPLLKH